MSVMFIVKQLVKRRFVKYHFLSKISCCVNENYSKLSIKTK